MKFKTDEVIGLEVHVELNTLTKLFCSCPTRGSSEPNTLTCDVCLGLPGSKPVLNKKAVDYALRLCMALNSDIDKELIFSRKTYFYPDMSKNYQITQYDRPIGVGGHLQLPDGTKIGLERVHIEEDPAALMHPGGMHKSNSVLVDYNRSGRPLLEIVTKPEITSAAQARDFLKALITVLQYLQIFDISDGTIKADANVSIKASGYTRAEIKNISGFKEIEKALMYELLRQKEALLQGQKIVQQTRSWDSETGITQSLRTKESEDDYGYILDPDLTITELTDDWQKTIKETLPELHHDREKRYKKEFNLSSDDAKVLTQDYNLSEFFEKLTKEVDPILAAKWARRELARVLNYNKLDFSDIKFDHTHFSKLLILLEQKKITETVAQKILEQLVVKPFDVEHYVQKHGLKMVSDSNQLELWAAKAIDDNPKTVEEYAKGKEQAFNFLMGQVMRQSKGAASPQEVRQILKKLLK
ncbi:Asp-tRNA(Asn)/Glu-tRNA(Gln) amidotransferase subunit GatB [Candidatus Woesearchaeota archaeon]|nr:Asp-tRNA(Asn)/Glu-tRNA(Gln) amidotransferase subunit GatB [Candidatus Woesearchaeota archaeon]